MLRYSGCFNGTVSRSLSSPGLVCVVKPEGVPQLCQTDEIGELCVCSIATGTSYYGLTGMTKNTFEVRVPPPLPPLPPQHR